MTHIGQELIVLVLAWLRMGWYIMMVKLDPMQCGAVLVVFNSK